MKTISRTLLGLFCASSCLAAMVHPLTVDLRKKNDPFSIETAAFSTPLIRLYVEEDGSAYTDIDGCTAVLYFATSNTARVGMAVTNTAAGGSYFDWRLTQNQTATNGTYFAQIYLCGPSNEVEELLRGELILDVPGGLAPVTPFAWNFTNIYDRVDGMLAALSNSLDQVAFDGELDATFTNSPAYGISAADIAAWLAGARNASNALVAVAAVSARVDQVSERLATVESGSFTGSVTAADFLAGAAGSSNVVTATGLQDVSTPLAHGSTAFGWGNHAEAGYLTAENDPTLTAGTSVTIGDGVGNGVGENILLNFDSGTEDGVIWWSGADGEFSIYKPWRFLGTSLDAYGRVQFGAGNASDRVSIDSSAWSVSTAGVAVAASWGYSSGLSLESNAAGSNLVIRTQSGTIQTNATRGDLAAVAANVVAVAVDVAKNAAAIDRGEQVSMELGLQLSALSALDGMPYSYGYWDSYADTNYVSSDSVNLFYYPDGDYYESQYSAGSTLSNNMQCFLLMNDNAASTAIADEVGDHGPIVSGLNTSTMSTNGLIGTALRFSGTVAAGDYIDANTAVAGNVSWSVNSWFLIEVGAEQESNYGWIYCESNTKSGSSQAYMGHVIYTDGNVSFGWNDRQGHSGGTIGTGHNFADGQWHMITCTVDASKNWAIFVDTNSVLSGTHNSNDRWIYAKIGRNCYVAGNSFNGAMDLLTVWQGYVLTMSDIRHLYNSGTGTVDMTTAGTTGGNMTIRSVTHQQLTPPTEYTVSVIAKATDDPLAGNLVAWASNDGGTTRDRCNLTLRGYWDQGAGTLLYVGGTNFTSAVSANTNVITYIGTTNLANGIQVHGAALLTD